MSPIDLRTDTSDPTPMQRCLNRWHDCVGGDASALEAVLADDVVLHSPVLFRPVEGKAVVTVYLTGALMTFVAPHDPPAAPARPRRDGWDGRFRYVRTVVDTHDAVLEFETTMAGMYVNGVDMITCDDDGMIVDFKVMVRPSRGLDAVAEMMGAALEKLGGASERAGTGTDDLGE